MNDTDQFALEFYETKKRHRSTDPATSKAAAEDVTRSGTAARQAEQVLNLVRQCPKSTSKELAFIAARHADTRHLDYHAIARRLPELEKTGLVKKGPARKCTQLVLNGNRRKAVTWEPL
tara:strand:+ start:73 stop:429 length:357 start_codon:yes stop_codon:yes gene_type:complete